MHATYWFSSQVRSAVCAGAGAAGEGPEHSAVCGGLLLGKDLLAFISLGMSNTEEVVGVGSW